MRIHSCSLVTAIILGWGFAAAHVSLSAEAVASRDVHGLKVSATRRHLVDGQTGQPVFVLADTAWNLGALTLAEVDVYLESREKHGFNMIMFALNFAPQAEERNAYGHPAFIGQDKTELNPAYFEYCDAVVRKCAGRGMYVMLYAMWAGKTAGTMNNFTAEQLNKVGLALGARYRGWRNVILCAGGEATPHYIEVAPINALGAGLKSGCAGENLVVVHPVSEHSTSEFFSDATWLDFHMIQGKSGKADKNTAYDVAALVLRDFQNAETKPTMMAEHRYESGTEEDPLIQRRGLYQSVFAGACGYAYGHNALWQMTPHTGQPWMLKGWPPGVSHWKQALNTKAVSQLRHIKTLLARFPDFDRVPDQSLVLSGQGQDIFTRVQVMRDGTRRAKDATLVMAYLSARGEVTLDTTVLNAPTLSLTWFNPETGAIEGSPERVPNTGRLTLKERVQYADSVAIIESAGSTTGGQTP